MTQLTNMQMRDVEALLHPYTNAVQHRQTGPHVIERGEGVRVYDDAGRSFIEGMAGLWCCGLGFGDEELVASAQEQLAKLPYYHLFGGRSFEPAIELAERIKDLAPDMARVIYQSSGSEANDTQIKLTWYMNNARGKPEKKKIISRIKGYHGVTLVAASLTGLPNNHRSFDLPFDGILHTTCPHFWREGKPGESEADFTKRLAQDLEDLIVKEGPDTVAAFIAEPVMGAGGVIIPPEGYFPAMAEVCHRYDVRMITDEVICGFGRTGEWFGSDTLNLPRNSMSIAKQLTSGYVPLSAVVMDREMTEIVEDHSGQIGVLGHGFTYGGHPLGCAVGITTLDIYKRRDIPGHVRKVAPVLSKHLKAAADHPLVGEARSIGLMGGLELSPDKSPSGFAQPGKTGARLSKELLDRGVILRAIGDVVAVCPPMIISEDELDEMFSVMPDALDATHAWAKSEGLMS